jgi:hypothetical protein
MTKIRTMTMESMEWYGTVHMDSMDYSMDSIWNGMEQSIWIHVFHGFHMEWNFIKKFTKSNMESMFIPWTGFHALDSMDSTWIPYGTDT